MTDRAKATWFFLLAAVLIGVPYIVVFAIGSAWMWRNGWLWYWVLGTGVPTVLGLFLLEWARRLVFPPAVEMPSPPTAAAPAGQSAREAVQAMSRHWQTVNPPLDQPEALEKFAVDAFWEVLETVARHYHPDADHPASQVPVARIAALVERVARDFRLAFVENVPWGNQVTPADILRWKKKGELAQRIGVYVWQLNRVRRFCMQPAAAVVQELHDHWGQNVASKSVDRLKLWAIDYCITKAGDYAIQLYSGGFVLDDEYRPRVSKQIREVPFEQEPLQVLVVGQVKAGKSSVINALIGEMRAPVDALPSTDAVTMHECQPAGMPRMILRDTPGYGAVGDKAGPFAPLAEEIEECDLLVLVCTALSAAREIDRRLLRAVHESYRQNPKRAKPPVVYVMTHVDRLPEASVGEAAQAVAEDFGTTADQIVGLCAEWGRVSGMDRLQSVIREIMPEAERLKCARCIRQIRREQDDDRILRQLLHGLRLTGGWMAGRR